MKDTKQEIFREEEKRLVKIFRRIPKNIRLFIYILSLFICFSGGFSSRPFFDNLHIENITNHFSVKGNSNVSIGKVEGVETVNIGTNNCLFKYCSNFQDDKWKYKERFNILQEDPLIVKSPNSKSLPGATMFYDEEVGNFTMQAFLTPMSTPSANLALAYGHFIRCIIGDGDYSKISCQMNSTYPSTVENWSYFDSIGKLYGRNQHYQISRFLVNNEIQIKFSILKVNDRKQIEIKINDQVPMNWFIPKEFENRTQREKVGIGLFTAGQDDVKAVFKQFQLDPHI